MPIKKIDLVNGAFIELRISGLTVDPIPSEIQDALTELEEMMAEYEGDGLHVDYNFEENPDQNSPANIDKSVSSTIKKNLAVRLSVRYGKPANPSLVSVAAASYSRIKGRIAGDRLKETQYPSRQPIGSGNHIYGRSSLYYYKENRAPADSNIITIGDIADYAESFSDFLDLGQSIASYSIVAGDGLNIVSHTETDGVIFYRVEAEASDLFFSQVKIQVETSNGTKLTKKISFDIKTNETVGVN